MLWYTCYRCAKPSQPYDLHLCDLPSSSSSSSAFNVRGPHITQAWDVRHPRWHGSDGCPQQHSVVSCTNSTTFNGSGYTRLCQGSSMNSWLTWGYWYMFLLLKELLQPDGLPAPTHPLGRGVFNETPSIQYNHHHHQIQNWKRAGYHLSSNLPAESNHKSYNATNFKTRYLIMKKYNIWRSVGIYHPSPGKVLHKIVFVSKF